MTGSYLPCVLFLKVQQFVLYVGELYGQCFVAPNDMETILRVLHSI